jgi:hypothetical protein
VDVIKVNKSMHAGNIEVPFVVKPLIDVAEAVDLPVIARENSDVLQSHAATRETLDEWAVGSACYMCHTCTNFGVQGAEGRPCAKGLSDLIKRRSLARKNAKAFSSEGDS